MTSARPFSGDSLRDLAWRVKAKARIAEIAALRVKLTKKGGKLSGLCPFHAEKTPSFFVFPDKNTYHCFGCGAGGDAIAFVMAIEGCDFAEAVRRLAEMYAPHEGLAAARPAPRLFRDAAPPPVRDTRQEEEDERRAIAQAQEMVARARPLKGTLAEDYLRTRGIDLERLPEGATEDLLFDPAVPFYHAAAGQPRAQKIGTFPAMVAPLRDADGMIRAAHVTYLAPRGPNGVCLGKLALPDPDSPGKMLPAKKVRGRPMGCAIRIGLEGAIMGIAEGIENALSGMIARPGIPIWAAYSLGNIAGGGRVVNPAHREMHPAKEGVFLPSRWPDFRRPGWVPPKDCAVLYLMAENDGDRAATACLIERATRRFMGMGIRVFTVWSPEGADHNDVLRGAGGET